MSIVNDWGALPGDSVVFGGVVSNAHALEALMARVDGRAVVFTGDVTGYCGEPGRALTLMRRGGALAIRGNCEDNLAAGASDCGCGFTEGSVCDTAAVRWFAHAAGEATAADRAWMAALPDLAVVEVHGRRWGVIHGGVRAVNRFVWPGDRVVMAEEIAAFEALAGPVDGILAGHCGLPFCEPVGRHLWVNAGAVGLPANDGTSATSFAVLGVDGPRIERLDYDWRGAQAAMRAAGLTDGYHLTLETGYWPSEEILPERLRRAVV